MEERQLNAFTGASDHSLKLALARELERLYPIGEPIPPNLRSYIDRLEQALDQRAARQ
jgi:hypothetical protein